MGYLNKRQIDRQTDIQIWEVNPSVLPLDHPAAERNIFPYFKKSARKINARYTGYKGCKDNTRMFMATLKFTILDCSV